MAELCIKDPKNMGLFCADHSCCGTCGWNPEVAERRKQQRMERIPAVEQEQTRRTDGAAVPDQCLDCVRLQWCSDNGCLKEKACRWRQQADPVDADLLAEIKERMR